MHAIERLRWVAGTRWAPAGELAAEAAWALAELAADEPVAVLPACRRLLDRHPGCGPLWWVAATVLTSPDAVAEATRCADLLLEDPTEDLLPEAVPAASRAVRRGSLADVAGADLVVVTADALGHGGAVVDGGAAGLLAAAVELQVPAWVVAGVGRLLPPRLWDALCPRIGSRHAADRHGPEIVPLRGVTTVVGPTGADALDVALARPSCGEPPELIGHRTRG